MATSLLKTKLYIPPPRPELVPRPRLLEQLEAGFHRRFTLVCAPAGFGKTTLLSEYVATCGAHWRVAWVSLDLGDNDPIRFWSHVIAALQTIEPEVGHASLAMLRTAGVAPTSSRAASPPAAAAPLSIETLLTGLINEIALLLPCPEPGEECSCILVLDDFHLISEPQIHEGLAFLVDNLPPQLHLVVSSRADPPWPLARLRARGHLTELRAPDLRFTPEEAIAFLNDAMGLDLSPEDVAALEARTEGWIAGLQMAALALRSLIEEQALSPDPQRRAPTARSLSAFVQAFTGSHRFVLDYLVEEVLEKQRPDIREFLLRTSILERMTAPLCDAILETAGGRRDDPDQSQPPAPSQQILEQLEASNLFLIPLDDERRWYRYHGLFADLLRSRLEQTQPGASATLHRRASEWYEENRLIAEAVSHSLAGGDIERVANLVEGNALLMVSHGELTTLMNWLSSLPEQIVSARPWLCLAHAWVLVFAGQFEAVEPLLQDAEQALDPEQSGPARVGTDGPPVTDPEGVRQWGHITSIRAYIAFLSGDWVRASDLALDALLHLPEADLMARSYLKSLLGVLLRSVGELEAAEQMTAEAIAISKEAGDSHVTMLALGDLAALQSVRGQLHQSFSTAQELLRLADGYVRQGGRRLPISGRARCRMGRLHYEWNQLEAALRCAREGVELCRQWGWADFLTSGYLVLARVLWATGDVEDARGALRASRQIARSISLQYEAGVAASEALFHLRAGNTAAASRWAQESGLGIEDDFEFGAYSEYLTLARVLIAQGQLEDAARLLGRQLSMVQVAGAQHFVVETLVLQALTLKAQGQRDRALDTLERCLLLAKPQGYVRTFVDEGPALGALLQTLAVPGELQDYVQSILAAFEGERPDEAGAAIRPRTDPFSPAPIEPLTERELEVLRLLNTNLSAAEIAQELYVSVHTVRSHVKSIYGKLGAHSRIEAVARAQELHLT